MNKDDAFIQSQVEEALKDKRFFRNAEIKIEARNGEVTLFGFVDVLAEKWAAGEAVARVPGVVSIDNSLTVAIDGHLEDNEIAEMVREKLAADPRVDLHQLSATVKEGVVYLQGDVGSLAEKESAEQVAAETRGVKEIVSYVYVGNGDFNIDDATLTNAVERALANSAIVSARDVVTTVSGGRVFFSGIVDTPEQSEAAARIAAQVPGVKKIHNRLGTRHGTRNEDYRLANAIRAELGGSGLGGVRCFVLDRTAFLDGAVGTPEQKYMAEEIAGKYDGIDGISNGIQIS